MREKAVLISGDTPLVGIHCQPDGPATQAPLLLLWDTGMIHRVGPNRAYVELARAAAGRGHASLRFDLSGMGDSPAARGGGVRMDRVVSEIQSVMNWAEGNGHTAGFVLVGLCSGADDAHHVAVVDPRVRGAVCVDGYTFSTPRFWRTRLARKLQNPFALCATILRRGGRVLGMNSGGAGNGTVESDFAWSMPARGKVVHDINTTTARGMHWLCVFTREVEDSYNYDDQFVDMLPGLERLENVTWRYMSDADHTLSTIADRHSFVKMVLDWMSENFS